MTQLDWKQYARTARQAAAEGCVLLKNDNQTLPLRKGETVSLFGRTQLNYYKSGTGSGGMVNVPYVVGIYEGLKQSGSVLLNEGLRLKYQEWEKDHPFDAGLGWAQEPWCQEEMPLSQAEVTDAADKSDTAIMIIGRTAGEDKDNKAEEGSYLLTKEEETLLGLICRSFKRSVVVLNTGNVIDMKWVQQYQPSAVLYVWQGGMEGGNAAADVLTGNVNPCGKLSDTIAQDIEDYPSTRDFGSDTCNYYREDIYVGYRYFETIAKEKVCYPFGYGLSYTQFTLKTETVMKDTCSVEVKVKVRNCGIAAGKEVIQIYYAPAQGRLSKPLRNLIRFRKTKQLAPGEEEEQTFLIDVREMASYDDCGCTGHKSCWVVEAGIYDIYAGTDVRSAALAGTIKAAEDMVTQTLTQQLAPVRPFRRMKLAESQNGAFCLQEEDVPLRERSHPVHRETEGTIAAASSCLGDQGYKLADVRNKRCSMEQFLEQIPDEELVCLTRGEGMCSPKVTPGTAAAFGGVTQGLQAFGIPLACCADGPGGIRMDSGTKAFCIPGGMALACSFNEPLVEELFTYVGMELRKNRVDTILGPGMNLHRNPLNGRNFEYFSEDPLLTGRIAVSQLKGMEKWGVTGTLKHFACNNQEHKRHDADSVVSERALRELYLKGFEIAVKEGGAYSIMSTYGALNGIWTAGNYELLTKILREEWGFKGIVMTDWWAKINEEGEAASVQNTPPMVRAQNDLYMVTANASENSLGDTTLEGLKDGRITRKELLRNASNICGAILRMPAMSRSQGAEEQWEDANLYMAEESGGEILQKVSVEGVCELDVTHLVSRKGSSAFYYAQIHRKGAYALSLKLRAEAAAGELAQIPVSVFINNQLAGTISVSGAQKDWVTRELRFDVFTAIDNYIKLYFAESGMEIMSMEIRPLDGEQ